MRERFYRWLAKRERLEIERIKTKEMFTGYVSIREYRYMTKKGVW